MHSDLETSRTELAAAAAQAIDALTAAADAATERSTRRADASPARQPHLGLSDVDSQATHETGSGEWAGLRLRGRAGQSVDPSAVLCFTLRAVLAAMFGSQAPAVPHLAGLTGDLGRRADGLLAGVPAVPPRPRLTRVTDRMPTGEPPPYLVRAARDKAPRAHARLEGTGQARLLPSRPRPDHRLGRGRDVGGVQLDPVASSSPTRAAATSSARVRESACTVREIVHNAPSSSVIATPFGHGALGVSVPPGRVRERFMGGASHPRPTRPGCRLRVVVWTLGRGRNRQSGILIISAGRT
jgi:hypothetical protein